MLAKIRLYSSMQDLARSCRCSGVCCNFHSTEQEPIFLTHVVVKLFDSIIKAKGVGQIISKKLNEKNIYTKIDLLLRLPIGTIDRRFCPTLDQLEIGKISTIFVRPIKYNFPRIRNLPFRVTCEDKFGKIDIVFFNVRENYIRQQLPLNTEIIISGKITIYKNKFQMTNPDYIQTIDKEMSIKKIMSKYSNLSGISPKTIQKIYFEESKDIGEIDEWHDKNFINERGWSSWSSSIKKLQCYAFFYVL